ncbi:MAG: response regulator [Fibrobacterota bacterium]|nr:MAG: response regulator [Fibrobacterota bacterium]
MNRSSKAGEAFDRGQLTIHSVVFFALSILCYQFASTQTGTPVIWVPTAYALAIVLHLDRKERWPVMGAFFLAGVLARLFQLGSVLEAIEQGIGLLLEIQLATLLFDRFVVWRGPQLKIEDALKMLFIVLFIASPVACAMMASSAFLRSGVPVVSTFRTLWTSDASGMALLLLPGMVFDRSKWSSFFHLKQMVEYLVQVAALLVLTQMCLYYVATPFIFLTIPFCILAIRKGLAHTSIVIWMVMALSTVLLKFDLVSPPRAFRTDDPFLLWAGATMAAFLPILIGVIVGQVDFQMQEMRRSRKVLQTVIDSIPGLVGAWDGNLRIRLANKAFEEWFGMGRDSLAGVSFPELVGQDTYRTLEGGIERVLRGEVVEFETELETEAGQSPVLVNLVPDNEDGKIIGFFSLVTDISQVKTEQRSRLDSLARLQDVIDGATGYSFIATSMEGTIQLFSKGAERMLGWSAQEVVGKETPRLIHLEEETRERSKQILTTTGRDASGFGVFTDAPLHGEVDTREWTYVRKDGSKFPVQLTVMALHDHVGVVNGFVGIARDLSADKEILHTMEEARSQAERASSMKSEFVANMSHEIRTPLNAVLGMVQLLGKTTLTPIQMKYLDMIRKSGKSLLGILEDILDFSKIEAGRLRIEPVDFQLDDILESVASLASMNASGKDVEVSFTVDPLVPVQLHGDPLRIQQILLNLMGNALKFTSQGEVNLSIELLSKDQNQMRIGFRVRDTGVGMSDEQQQRLFQPFSQIDSSNTRRYGGTGLGLVISKNLVELMGGHVGVRSMSRIGTEFFVSLPFPVAQSSDPGLAGMQNHALHVLCLDDQPSTQASLDAAASRWGWRMECVEAWQDFLTLLERREDVDPFDAILVDAGTPQWEDRKSIARIREICGREIPVVKMVRNLMDSPADEGIRLLDGILVKPVTPMALLKAFKSATSHPTSAVDESKPNPDRPGEDYKALNGVRVLLVEDNAFNQVVAAETLQALGASVEVAEHGKVALEKLKKSPQGYDLVLMDVQMPVMDGFAATRAIRAELKLDLPVVAMTAGVLASDRAKCMDSGMDDFLTKPFEVEQLVAIFRKQLKIVASKEPASAPAKGDASRVFDPDPLLRNLGNNADALRVVRTLVKQFIGTAPGSIKFGRECSQRGDLEEALRSFHNLKSSSATLGAMAFSAIAALIEQGLQESERKNQAGLIDQLEKELVLIQEQAKLWLERNAPASG